uniref:cytotoxic and regulatory T-cell molecule isoform X2 n=1 Tax=Semicossyphus pulcher TaxID=241346 RepID=UPI0037E797B7
MGQKLQLSVFMVLVQVSLAVQEQMTIKQGHTVNLSCSITNAHRTKVEWRNPEGYVMFFSHNKGDECNFSQNNKTLKDKRYTIIKLSKSEFTVSISNVTFKDGGSYTCTQYGSPPTVKKVEVTVLGLPKMSVAKHEGKSVVKCTAEGTRYAPQIFWKLNNGPEIQAYADIVHEDKKYVSMDMLTVDPLGKRVTVKCLIRHPALHSQPLMNFVKIGRKDKFYRTTTTNSPTARPPGSPEVLRTTSWSRITTRVVSPTSSESSVRLSTFPVTVPTGFPLSPVPSTDSHLSATADSRASVSSVTTRRNETVSNATSTADWISVAQTTEEITSFNSTDGNTTGSFNNPKMQAGAVGSSSLLVFLVTFLILCLLVVVIFFTIKLRRAHLAWKRENEDSDPSEESSKSKSSQEEKSTQGQRRRGLFNTAFTQYVVEEPTVITSVINTTAMATTESLNKEQTSQRQTLGQTSAKCDIKETEL